MQPPGAPKSGGQSYQPLTERKVSGDYWVTESGEGITKDKQNDGIFYVENLNIYQVSM